MGTISVTLQSIVCNSVSEGNQDEIYVICQSDAGLPRRFPDNQPFAHKDMSSGQTWDINETIEYSRDLLITVYDADPPEPPEFSDYLISCDYTLINIPPHFTMSNADGANYTINLAVNAAVSE